MKSIRNLIISLLSLYETLSPDILFVDIILADNMNGVDVVKQVRTFGDPMIIYTTATMSGDLLNEAKLTKPDAFLQKPFDEKQVKVTTEFALHAYVEGRKKIQELKKISDQQIQSIKELSETNAHLIAATWRERELKKQLADSVEELQNSKNIIEKQNKRISESINYAKRLQQAIIPSEKDLKGVIDQSFMVYRPKDVVSGDFPWYCIKGDYLYVGAVDCTGHGVPGAMLSMIGYLLLNGIIESEKEGVLPSNVLMKLHKQVVKTLKQDVEGNNASDGMDIGLCRINTKTNEVAYSGAHRPLFYLSSDGMQQFKGDRYPIGGVQYKGKNTFTDTVLEMNQGESIYFFSDGLPDQFGGPDIRKYGSKRIQNLIVDNKDLEFNQLKSLFENSVDDWMKDEKQLDDMLLIGMKF